MLKNGTELEVRAMIDLILGNPFVLGISFHSGALVVNYPWNDGRVRERVLLLSLRFLNYLSDNRLNNQQSYTSFAKFFVHCKLWHFYRLN
jgi:hypothetical protein